MFPRAPLRKAGVSVGGAGPGREHAAYEDPSRLFELQKQEVRGQVMNPDTKPQRLDSIDRQGQQYDPKFSCVDPVL